MRREAVRCVEREILARVVTEVVLMSMESRREVFGLDGFCGMSLD